MKKTICSIIVFLLMVSSIIAQVRIEEKVDEMTGKTQYRTTEDIILLKDKKAVVMSPIVQKSGKKLKMGYVALVQTGLGCMEGSSLIILFENGERIKFGQFNDFDCDMAIFRLDKKEQQKLSKLPVDKIRFTNGRNYEEITQEIDYSDYFMDAFTSLASQNQTIK